VGDTVKTYRAIFRGAGLNWFFQVGSYDIAVPFTSARVWFPWNTDDLTSQAASNLEQTLINYCVDVADLKQVDATEIADVPVVAGALMRLVERDGQLILDDRRVPYSGRPVSAIHWAGYGMGPLMPYRGTFLRYRLAGTAPARRRRYRVEAWADQAAQMTPRHTYHELRGAPYRLRSWLSARGLAKWHGSSAG